MAIVTHGNKFNYYEINRTKKQIRDIKMANLAVSNAARKSKGSKKNLANPPFEDILIAFDASAKPSGTIKDYYLAEAALFHIPGAIEFGYGQSRTWDADCLLNKRLNSQIIKYSLARIKLAAYCVQINSNRSYQMKQFYKYIESSDKATISFILGGVFSYLSALHWVESDNDFIEHFLHASNLAISSLQLEKKNSRKTPDYIVSSVGKKWHVFESKGGTIIKRWMRIEEGLRQLGIVTHISWDENTATSVNTEVCTHACIDASNEIDVAVVDPIYDKRSDLKINKTVAFLMEKIICLDLFEFFSRGGQVKKIEDKSKWIFTQSTDFDGLEFAIPEDYLNNKDTLRKRLAIYITIRDVLKNLRGTNRAHVKNHMKSDIEDSLKSYPDELTKALELDLDSILNKTFEGALLEITEQLGLKELALELKKCDDMLKIELSNAALKCRSTSGMLSGKNISSPDFWNGVKRTGRPKPTF